MTQNPNTAFLSVSLSRVCHPLPLARKWEARSASSLIDIGSFGNFCLPRVHRVNSTISGSTYIAGRARAQSSSVHSGASGP